MNKELDRQKLLEEARELEKEINKYNLTDDQRKLERIELLKKYNKTKDCAQLVLGQLAELECLSTSELYKNLKLNFDD